MSHYSILKIAFIRDYLLTVRNQMQESAIMNTAVYQILLVFVEAVLLVQATQANTKVSWPYGKYGLPKAKSGCPEETWQEGWRKQDVARGQSALSIDSQMEIRRPAFNRTFCLKTKTGVLGTRLWPKGFYCIYKATNSSCPTGMSQGSVQWDDADISNANLHGGVLPDGVYDSNTKIKYCCQNMGRWFDPIELPIHRPFYLLPHNNSAVSFPRCQLVQWTMSWLEYIDYDTEDPQKSTTRTSGDRSVGDHVFNENIRFSYPFSGALVRTYYCYYRGCRYEMKKNEGVLSSPKFNSDPQFRKCSWLITVNDSSLVISIQLTQLHNPCKESRLFIYDGMNEASRLLALYCSNILSRETEHQIVSSGNQVLVIFSSIKPTENLKTRPHFEAKYKAMRPGFSEDAATTSNPQSPKSKKCSKTALTSTLAMSLVLLVIMILLVIFRGKVIQFLRKMFYHKNRSSEETKKTEDALSCRNEAYNEGMTTKQQNSDEDNYTDLIVEDTTHPENNYQSLRDHRKPGDAPNSALDDYVIAAYVNTKDAQHNPNDNVYDYANYE